MPEVEHWVEDDEETCSARGVFELDHVEITVECGKAMNHISEGHRAILTRGAGKRVVFEWAEDEGGKKHD